MENHSLKTESSKDPRLDLIQAILDRVRTDAFYSKGVREGSKWVPDRTGGVDNELRPGHVIMHLSGERRIGTLFLKPGCGDTSIGLIDIDNHGGSRGWASVLSDAKAIAHKLSSDGVQFNLLRSGGGSGIHVWVLWQATYSAAHIRNYLSTVVIEAGLELRTGATGIEVFPKQDRVPLGGYGSQASLPFWNGTGYVDLATGDDVEPGAVAINAVAPPHCPPRYEPDMLRCSSPAEWKDEVGKLTSALACISSNDRDTWRDVGFALHHVSGGSAEGFALFAKWSVEQYTLTDRSSLADDEELRKLWDGCDPQGGITQRHIYWLAYQAGWSPQSGSALKSREELVVLLKEVDKADKTSRNDWLRHLLHADMDKVDCQHLVKAAGKAFGCSMKVINDTLKDLREEGNVVKEATNHHDHALNLIKRLKQLYDGRGLIHDGMHFYGCNVDNVWEVITDNQVIVYTGQLCAGMDTATKAGDFKSIADYAGKTIYEPEFFINAPRGIATRSMFYYVEQNGDGSFKLVQDVLKPKHRQRFKLDFDPDPEHPTPLFRKLLDAQINNGAAAGWEQSIQQFEGACLGGIVAPMQKTLLNLGVTNSGKGTFDRIMSNFYGASENTAADIYKLGDENVVAMLVSSKRNVTSEVPTHRGTTLPDDVFKRATGQDPLTAKLMYANKFSFRFVGGLIVNANLFPNTGDRGEAFWRRWIIAYWPYTIPDADRVVNLDEVIKAELPGILSWLLDGLYEVCKNGCIAVAADYGKHLTEWKIQSNIILRFLMDGDYVYLDKSGKAEIKRAALFDIFRVYLADRRIGSDLGRNKFYDDVRRYGIELGVVEAQDDDGCTVFRGVRALTDVEIMASQ